MELSKYSFGVGDRFGHQGKAQLKAVIQAKAAGVDICPVWNKSNREHSIIGTYPADVRAEADSAVTSLSWQGPYHVDADHINLSTVDAFIDPCDFFTLDVADSIGRAADNDYIETFVQMHGDLIGTLQIEGIGCQIVLSKSDLQHYAVHYLGAVKAAAQIYRHIASIKGAGNFITEISMDETNRSQTPAEMLVILAAVSDERIPAQTIAPKFTGRFNKGVDYVGDVAQFEREFNDDLAVIRYAVKKFTLPANLKLSVHSGSDKFSIYGAIRRTIRKFDAGLHVKTAGTTWLEELIGLAEADGEGLEVAKEVYAKSLSKYDELCGPYATVTDIDKSKLPTANEVKEWSSQTYVSILRHEQSNPAYNPHARQLLHVGYKVAAQMGDKYLRALEQFEPLVAKNVTENIFDRHIRRIFLG